MDPIAFPVFIGLMTSPLLFIRHVIRKFAVAMLSNTVPGKSFFIDVFGSKQRWQDMNDVFETLL